MFKQVQLSNEGLYFKVKMDSDVDFQKCLDTLLEQFRVIPHMVSVNGTPAIFKAIKSNFETL